MVFTSMFGDFLRRRGPRQRFPVISPASARYNRLRFTAPPRENSDFYQILSTGHARFLSCHGSSARILYVASAQGDSTRRSGLYHFLYGRPYAPLGTRV